jgi:hypothetical protein
VCFARRFTDIPALHAVLFDQVFECGEVTQCGAI